jgi:hypothetical protein
MTYFLTMVTNFIVEPITESVALITNKQSPSLCINQLSRGNLKCNLATDWSHDFSAGPETAGFRFRFRLAGFCRTGTGCFEGKFSVCRTEPVIFTFCHEHMKILLLS